MGGESSTVDHNSFVGRERELAELCTAIDDATAGRGSMFLISGGAGIGKTRLADEACSHAQRRGMRSAWGRSWDGGGAPAYWPWIQVLRVIVDGDGSPELRTLIDRDQPPAGRIRRQLTTRPVNGAAAIRVVQMAPAPHRYAESDEQRFRVFDAVCAAIKQVALVQPLILVFDDLHEADTPSLAMLKFLARELRSAHVVLIGTFREREMRRDRERAHLLDELVRESSRIRLCGLNAAEICTLIDVRTGIAPGAAIVEAVHQASGSNPFFAGEIIRVLELDSIGKPASAIAGLGRHGVGFLMADRLRTLSPEANSVLAIGAVIGSEFEVGLLRQVAGGTPEQILSALDEAAAHGIIGRLRPDRFRFAHELLRKAVYEQLPSAARASLHRAIGEALEQTHSRCEPAVVAAMANHFREAVSLGEIEKAITYSAQAGEHAAAVYAFEEAIAQ